MGEWQERTSWLLRDFVTSTKSAREGFEAMARFGNGDSSKSVVVHWCLMGPPACCENDQDALCKMMSHAIPTITNGFQTPLLYRMKHYGQASSWIKFGTCYFGLVPRALEMMQAGEPNSDCLSVADAFLGGVPSVGATEIDLQQLVSEAMDLDANYALQNKMRRGKVVEAMSNPNFAQHAIVIDEFIRPIERGINYLLGHTKIVHDMWFLGQGHPKCQELRQAAMEKFRYVVSGRFADHLIGLYMNLYRMALQRLFAWA